MPQDPYAEFGGKSGADPYADFGGQYRPPVQPKSLFLKPGQPIPVHKEAQLPPIPGPSKVLAFGTDALPALGATGFALATDGLSIPATILAAGVGGEAGEAAKQILAHVTGQPSPSSSREAMADIGREGIRQGAYELAGQAITAPIRGVLGGVLKRAASSPASQEALRLSEKYGLRLTPAEIAGDTPMGYAARAAQHVSDTSLVGSPIASKARAEGLAAADQAANDFLKAIHPATSPAAAGKSAQEALPQAARFFRQRGSELLHDAISKMPEAQVDISPIEKEAKRVVEEEIRPLSQRFGKLGAPESGESRILSGLRKEESDHPEARALLERMSDAGNDRAVSAILEQIEGLNGEIPFSMAVDLRSRLLAMGREGGPLATSRSRGLAKRLSSMLLEQMNQSAAKSSPEAFQAWKAFRDYYREGSELFDRGVIKGLAKSSPERLVAAMNTPSKAEQVKKALLEYAGPNDNFDRKEVFDQLREQWLRQRILQVQGDADAPDKAVRSMAARISQNKHVINVLFDDPRGKQVINNLEALGRTMDRVSKSGGLSFLGIYEALRAAGAVLSMRFGYGYEGLATFEGLPYVITKVLHSPNATRLLIKGIYELPKSASTGTASLVRALEVASQYQKGRTRTPIHSESTLPPIPGMVQ